VLIGASTGVGCTLRASTIQRIWLKAGGRSKAQRLQIRTGQGSKINARPIRREKAERDSLQSNALGHRFKRFFFVGLYVGHAAKTFKLVNYFNGIWRKLRDSNPGHSESSVFFETSSVYHYGTFPQNLIVGGNIIFLQTHRAGSLRSTAVGDTASRKK
jgi:hypothetical protein